MRTNKFLQIWDSIKGSLNAENSEPIDIKAGQYKGVSYEYSLDLMERHWNVDICFGQQMREYIFVPYQLIRITRKQLTVQ